MSIDNRFNGHAKAQQSRLSSAHPSTPADARWPSLLSSHQPAPHPQHVVSAQRDLRRRRSLSQNAGLLRGDLGPCVAGHVLRRAARPRPRGCTAGSHVSCHAAACPPGTQDSGTAGGGDVGGGGPGGGGGGPGGGPGGGGGGNAPTTSGLAGGGTGGGTSSSDSSGRGGAKRARASSGSMHMAGPNTATTKTRDDEWLCCSLSGPHACMATIKTHMREDAAATRPNTHTHRQPAQPDRPTSGHAATPPFPHNSHRNHQKRAITNDNKTITNDNNAITCYRGVIAVLSRCFRGAR